MEHIFSFTENTIILPHNVAFTNTQAVDTINPRRPRSMKPYRRSNKVLMVELRSASRLGRIRVLAREYAIDVHSLWKYGAPFPTFLKIIGTLILCLLVVLPLVYPIFVVVVTYFTCESLYLSWSRDQPLQFLPLSIARLAVDRIFRPINPQEMWKVREVLTRGILLAHSLATSVDYLCVMQGLLEEA